MSPYFLFKARRIPKLNLPVLDLNLEIIFLSPSWNGLHMGRCFIKDKGTRYHKQETAGSARSNVGVRTQGQHGVRKNGPRALATMLVVTNWLGFIISITIISSDVHLSLRTVSLQHDTFFCFFVVFCLLRIYVSQFTIFWWSHKNITKV